VAARLPLTLDGGRPGLDRSLPTAERGATFDMAGDRLWVLSEHKVSRDRRQTAFPES